MIKRIWIVLLLICFFGIILYDDVAYAQEDHEKSKAIYVVFDNSGSMYDSGNMAWSQATYAMEIFASMMNYDNGDYMKVYTMHSITNSKSKKAVNVIDIKSQSDIEKIHTMLTTTAGGTPYGVVTDAASDIKSSTAQEKWVVVITDGMFDSDVPEEGIQTSL